MAFVRRLLDRFGGEAREMATASLHSRRALCCVFGRAVPIQGSPEALSILPIAYSRGEESTGRFREQNGLRLPYLGAHFREKLGFDD